MGKVAQQFGRRLALLAFGMAAQMVVTPVSSHAQLTDQTTYQQHVVWYADPSRCQSRGFAPLARTDVVCAFPLPPVPYGQTLVLTHIGGSIAGVNSMARFGLTTDPDSGPVFVVPSDANSVFVEKVPIENDGSLEYLNLGRFNFDRETMLYIYQGHTPTITMRCQLDFNVLFKLYPNQGSASGSPWIDPAAFFTLTGYLIPAPPLTRR